MAAADVDMAPAATPRGTTMGGKEQLPWVEKYRPSSLQELVAHEDITRMIERMMAKKQLPHMLLHGPPGTGKTSTITALAKTMYKEKYRSMTLELNASDARGIDVVREQIKTFVSVKQLFNTSSTDGQPKLVILDEADNMTQTAQFALRRMIEQYAPNARFIMICNYSSKIIPALQSRCTKLRFAPLTEEQIVGRDVPVGKAGPRKITGLCGEFHGDVRRKLSWWEISDNEDYPGRWLVVTLSKLEHKAWPGPWFEGPLNPHRKTSFGWAPLHMSEHLAKMLKPEDEFLQRLPPGEPHEYIKSLYTGILPERLCTGIEDDEGDTPEQISLVLHLNAEALELATGLVPLEELFAAEVEPDRLDIYLRFDGFSICAGTLTGFVVPELTSWEITNVRRKELPAEGGAKNPAFYNPALRVTLVKARDFQDTWGHVFAGLRLPQLQPPPERMNVMERMLRAAALSPAAPMQVTAKTERAQRLCTRVECSQDRYKASVIMHLEDRLEEAVEKYKIDITTFFSMRVGERVLELNVVADTEYRMCVGGLGGNCRPADTTWEIIRERNQPDEEREHLALKIDLPKASRGMWKEVFARWEPWQVSEAMLQAMEEQLQLEAGAAEAQRQALEADRPAEERLPSQPAEQAATAPEALQAEMPAEVPPETDHPRGSPSETPAAPAAEEPAGLATTEAPGPLIGTAGEEETQARPAPTAEVEHQSSPADETVEEEIEVE